MMISNPNMPVSIIVVSYNHSQYIPQCLDSILSQTYSNWELIVADDASPDNSRETFDKWLEKIILNLLPKFIMKKIRGWYLY
ncbi:glycosyltransferase family 2 protein [Niabella hibiscisoli]|uniref:glycosyltransferase family 2 protein n=1 Tax=Niabella hibiscisoli TaxID=1825928 RepID=UPI00374D6210